MGLECCGNTENLLLRLVLGTISHDDAIVVYTLSMKSVEERFWMKVRVLEDNHSCWEWVASKNKKGYGQFRIEPGVSPVKAHRAAWLITEGSIPEGMVVMHQCDNPSCVRPSHLALGTHQDNMDDMVRKGRQSNGPAVKGRRKLTDWQVKEIRSRYATGLTSMRQLGAEYGIDSSNVSRLVNFQQWADA